MGFALGLVFVILFVLLFVAKKRCSRPLAVGSPAKNEAKADTADEKETEETEEKETDMSLAKKKKKLKKKKKKKAAIDLRRQTDLNRTLPALPSASSSSPSSVVQSSKASKGSNEAKQINPLVVTPMVEFPEEGKFVPYDSIESVNTSKMYQKCMNQSDTLEWVVTEKVHGANISINMTKNESKIAYTLFRRNGPLGASESFYGCREVVAKLAPKLSQVFNIISRRTRGGNFASVTVFGELFGGHYPHSAVPAFRDAKFVQKGLWYCPEVQFCAFDIAVDGNYLPFRDAIVTFRRAKLFHSAPLDFTNPSIAYSPSLDPAAIISHSFYQCNQWNVESFETTIPGLLGLPKIVDNIAEGVVIRTLDSPRLLIKKKSTKFAEISTTPGQAIKLPKALLLSDRATQLFSHLSCYVNEPRLQSVLSKQAFCADRYQVGSWLLEDAFADFVKNLEEPLDQWDEKALRSLTLELCLSLVAQHWLEIVEGRA